MSLNNADEDEEVGPFPLNGERASRQEDEPPMPVVDNHALRISARPGMGDVAMLGSLQVENRTISLWSRYDDVQHCVNSISKWVEDCHQQEPICDTVFPNNITIRGTSLLNDLDCLARLFYEEYIERNNPETEDATEIIVNSIATIPGFVKSVMLIDRESERMQVMQKRFMKRVLLHCGAVYQPSTEQVDENSNMLLPRSSGASPTYFRGVVLDSWLLTFLDSKNRVIKKRAVDYLEYVSNLKFKDYLLGTIPKEGTDRPGGDSASELKQKFIKTRRALFDQIANFRHLEALLLTLDYEEQERAAVCGAIKWSLQKSLRRPFVLLMNFCDFFFHFSLLILWRYWLLQDVRFEQGFLSSSDNEVYFTGALVAFAAIGYLIYRWLGDIISLARIKIGLAINYVVSLQTFVQIVVVALVIASTAGAWRLSSTTYNTIAAISLGMLWLKVLLFLQIVNEKMAAYLLALLQILARDIFFFMIIVFATTIGFGDMLYTLYATDVAFCTPFKELSDGFDSMGSNQTYRVLGEFLVDVVAGDVRATGRRFNGTQTFFVPSPEFAGAFNLYPLEYYPLENATFVNPANYSVQTDLVSKNPFCRSRRDSYFAIYRIYLGNFDFGEFRKTAFTTFLFVLITFIALIVLLNLLIAIIQLSYLLSMTKAERLFGRARLTFVSQALALEDLLHPNVRGEKKRHQGRELLLHHLLRLFTFVQLFVTAFAWAYGTEYISTYVYISRTGFMDAIWGLLFCLGLLPLFMVLFHLFVGWETDEIARKGFLRLIQRSALLTCLFRIPIRIFSLVTLGLPLRESVDDKRILEEPIESVEKPGGKRLDTTLQNLENRIDSMGSKMEEKFNARMTLMEDRIKSCIDKKQV